MLVLTRLDEAIKEFSEALRGKPDFAEARLSLAMALRQKGNLNEAIMNYKEYLRLRPQDASAQASLGEALKAKNQ